MKTAIIILLILTVTLLLMGCGHYGMGMGGHHYYNQTSSEPWHMNRNSPGAPGPYMEGNSIQDQGAYKGY